MNCPQRVRILYIIESLGRGGAERQLVNLLMFIDRSRFEPFVIMLDARYDLASELHQINVPLLCIDLSQVKDLMIVAGRLVSIVKLLQPDIIHTWLLRADFSGRIAAWICHIPIVTSVQNILYSEQIYQDNQYQKWWKLKVVQYIDLITGYLSNTWYVACSNTVKEHIERKLHVKNIETIYNSIDVLSEYTPNTIHRKIICIGRLVPQKGQKYLIEAMKEIRKYFPDISLSIVGDGLLLDTLQQYVHQHQVADCVHFLGIRQDIKQLLADHTLFAFPSLWEGLPLALLEAMAAGLPVVASDILPHREILTHGVQGLLVPPQNSQALADAIMVLLADPERARQMGAAGRQRIVEQFDINVTVRQWESLYCEMLSS